jgi:hypothetical protein
MGFAVGANGNKIIAVTGGLSAHRLDRQPDGSWAHTPLPLSDCMSPQSMSPGAQYASATWKAQACISSMIHQGRSAFRLREGAEATSDVVWSAGGYAFAEILLSRDIIVGRSDWFETQAGGRIKGTNPALSGDMSQSISMNEVGTRVALIDRGKAIRVYSLADHKPFLSRFDKGSVAVALDGSWIAAAKRAGPGEKAATIDVIPIAQAFAPDYRSRIRKRIEVDALPEQIYAAQGSVVAVLTTRPVTTVVFEAATGKPRFGPENGRAEALGAGRELLLIDESRRLVKTRNGSRLAPWEQVPAADGRPSSWSPLEGRPSPCCVCKQPTRRKRTLSSIRYVATAWCPSGRLSACPPRCSPPIDSSSPPMLARSQKPAGRGAERKSSYGR